MASFFFGEPFRRVLFSQNAAPLDWVETQSTHIIRINVPGLGKDDVTIQLDEGNVLHIKGEAKEEKAEKDKDKDKDVVWHVMERGNAEFERSLQLPMDNLKIDQIKAGVENGVLTIVVPKEPIQARPKPRHIPVSSRL